ncbi:hypothetical protein ACTFIW_008874, partial [Dictyostelium discoideum]
ARLLNKECLPFPPPIPLPPILEKMNSSSSKKFSIILIFTIWRSATWYPMIQAQVLRHHRHMFPQVTGTFQEWWYTVSLLLLTQSKVQLSMLKNKEKMFY